MGGYTKNENEHFGCEMYVALLTMDPSFVVCPAGVLPSVSLHIDLSTTFNVAGHRVKYCTAERHFDGISHGSIVIVVAEVVSKCRRRGILEVTEIKQRRRVTTTTAVKAAHDTLLTWNKREVS